jgi:hypothetical protein
MTLTMMQAAQQLLVAPLLWFFFFGGLVSLVVGIGLIFASGRTFTLFETMNRWVSFRKATKPLAIPRDSWPFIDRHRHLIAAAIAGGGALSILGLTLRLDLPKLVGVASLKFHVPISFIAWLASSVWWLLLVGSIVAVGVGIALGFFPNSLKQLDRWSNQWYSTRHIAKSADTMHTPLDQLARRHPRPMGIFIVVAALASVAVIGNRLF